MKSWLQSVQYQRRTSTEVNPPTRTPVGTGVVDLEELAEIEPPIALNELVTISSTNIKSCLSCSKAK